MSLDLQISADEEQYQESGTERVFSAPQCVLQTFLQSLQSGKTLKGQIVTFGL